LSCNPSQTEAVADRLIELREENEADALSWRRSRHSGRARLPSSRSKPLNVSRLLAALRFTASVLSRA
jgi:hypothetical protein